MLVRETPLVTEREVRDLPVVVADGDTLVAGPLVYLLTAGATLGRRGRIEQDPRRDVEHRARVVRAGTVGWRHSRVPAVGRGVIRVGSVYRGMVGVEYDTSVVV